MSLILGYIILLACAFGLAAGLYFGLTLIKLI
nr:cytochrome b6/f complex subunit VI [Chroomonas debatzensis]